MSSKNILMDAENIKKDIETVPKGLETIPGIYFGSRKDDFKDLIISVLSKSNLKQKYIDLLTSEESMILYGSAFTSDLVDDTHNYQVFEQIGDLSANKFIVTYIYNKFPQLKCSEGVKIAARLRINYGSKQCFSEIGRKLGFWDFISATNELRQRKMKPLLEDVFEAFLGATEIILDEKKRIGVGYAIVYSILSSIFNEMDISLKYENLYDAKTRLKELFDMYETKLGVLVYKENKNENSSMIISTVYRIEGGNNIKLGEGKASLKADAQQNAASYALKTLNSQGYIKQIPRLYSRMCGEFVEEVLQIDYKDDVNGLYQTKQKSKYQNKYMSTPIAFYCRIRSIKDVKECLKLKADVNILDTDGMFALDLLFVGKVDEQIVSEIFKEIIDHSKKIRMNKTVFDMYYQKYKNNILFSENESTINLHC
jgi:dsRNA-specific ribonuclease